MPQAREAIAKYHSHQEEDKAEGCTISHTHKVSMDDVIIANGASGALELALTALLDEDSVLLGTICIFCIASTRQTNNISTLMFYIPPKQLLHSQYHVLDSRCIKSLPRVMELP